MCGKCVADVSSAKGVQSSCTKLMKERKCMKHVLFAWFWDFAHFANRYQVWGLGLSFQATSSHHVSSLVCFFQNSLLSSANIPETFPPGTLPLRASDHPVHITSALVLNMQQRTRPNQNKFRPVVTHLKNKIRKTFDGGWPKSCNNGRKPPLKPPS